MQWCSRGGTWGNAVPPLFFLTLCKILARLHFLLTSISRRSPTSFFRTTPLHLCTNLYKYYARRATLTQSLSYRRDNEQFEISAQCNVSQRSEQPRNRELAL